LSYLIDVNNMKLPRKSKMNISRSLSDELFTFPFHRLCDTYHTSDVHKVAIHWLRVLLRIVGMNLGSNIGLTNCGSSASSATLGNPLVVRQEFWTHDRTTGGISINYIPCNFATNCIYIQAYYCCSRIRSLEFSTSNEFCAAALTFCNIASSVVGSLFYDALR
jgi:hypothetical protein